MRYLRGLILVFCLLGSACLLLASPRLTVQSVGFNGFYREGALTPVSVFVENTDKTIAGNLVFDFPKPVRMDPSLNETYRYPLTIPTGARQLHMLYMIPHAYRMPESVSFISKGKIVATANLPQMQPLFDADRMLVVVGGSGSALNGLNGVTIPDIVKVPMPRPWDTAGMEQWRVETVRQEMRHRLVKKPVGSVSPGTTPAHAPSRVSGYHEVTKGTVRVSQMGASQLPLNAEAYGSATTLALMSDVTENTLGEAQNALLEWVASGGNLLIAGGGVPARLQAPFYKQLLGPANGKKMRGRQILTDPDGHTLVTFPYNAGRVTLLDYDPDTSSSGNWQAMGAFYATQIGHDTASLCYSRLADGLDAATIMRSLRPVDIQVIMIYLLAYLIILVPVNYFILKKIDKREIAWCTTLAIILLFTVGAYGIGSFSKGHHLVINKFSVIEVARSQQMATALSYVSFFSPRSANYSVDLGETGSLVWRPLTQETDQSGEGQGTVPLHFVQNGDAMGLEKMHMGQWELRQLQTVHRVTLTKGIQVTFHRTGKHTSCTVKNETPYRFDRCSLYRRGRLNSAFALAPGETKKITLGMIESTSLSAANEDERYMIDDMSDEIRQVSSATFSNNTLFAYTRDPRAGPPVRLKANEDINAVTLFIFRL